MKIKCDYCGSMVDDTEKACPNCGGPLPGSRHTADGAPKTIGELKKWYTDRKLPPEEVTRFFIGKDVREPRAFGIYRTESGDYVVYKNKGDGSRAERYRGSDEAYAVNELYQRLKSEIVNQKSQNASRKTVSSPGLRGRSRGSGSGSGGMIVWTVVLAVVVVSILVALLDKTPGRGYYRYDGYDYYHQGSSWYYYDDDTDDWYEAGNYRELDEQINSDNEDEYRIDTHDGKSFEDSGWYTDTSDDSDSDSFWDSDSDWDSGDSWDSGGSDWDSDW